MRRTLLVLLTASLMASVHSVGQMTAASSVLSQTPVVSSSTPAMCTNEDGSRRDGPVDLLLLLDNSRSLGTTDPGDTRYAAIGSLLDSIATGLGKSRQVNFGLISFGSSASVKIPLGSLNLSNSAEADLLTDRIETLVPGKRSSQESRTDYIKALEAALEILEPSSDANCQIMVWFTDGVFDDRDLGKSSKYDSEREEQAKRLKDKMCEVGGLQAQFQQRRVNSFVVLLDAGVKPKYVYPASLAAMQGITGDPELPPNSPNSEISTWTCRTDSDHLGEVLLADDVAKLGGWLSLVGSIADGGRSASECPGSFASIQDFPAARHLEWVEISSFGSNQLPEISSLEVVTASGRRESAAKYLKVRTGSSPGKVMRWEFVPSSQEGLVQGWTLAGSNSLTDICVLVKERDFILRLTNDSRAPLAADNKASNTVVDNDLDDLRFCLQSCASTGDLEQAQVASKGEITALLEIDPSRLIFPEPIRIKVLRPDGPLVACDIELRRNGDMPDDKTVTAQGCSVDYSNVPEERDAKPVIVDSSALESDCDATFEVGPVDEKTFSFSVIARFEKNKSRCNGTLSLTMGKGFSKEIPVSFDLAPKAKTWLVFLLTTLGLLLVVLLNLLLINFLMRKLVRLPDPNTMRAVELPLTVSRSGNSGFALASSGTPLSSVTVRQEDIRVMGRGEGDSLTVDRSATKLFLKRPGFFRPLQGAVCRVAGDLPAGYSPSVGRVSGLPPVFRSAVVAHSVARVSDGEVTATLAVFVPLLGAGSGAKGVESILRDGNRMRGLATFCWDLVEGADSIPGAGRSAAIRATEAQSHGEPGEATTTPKPTTPNVPRRPRDQ